MRFQPFSRIAVALTVSTSLVLTACDSSSTTAAKTVSSISVSPATASLAIGGTQALTVTASYSDASSGALTSGVSFSSSSASIATASATGLVTAVAAGTATITATASGKSATSVITVAPAAPTLASIAITPAAVSIAVAATQQLTVTGTYSNASTAALPTGVTYASSATNVATVNASGLVTAVAAGTTTITATHTASALTTTRLITVTAPPTSSAALVFSDAYGSDVSFADFGGAANAVTIDATTLNAGRKTIKAVITGSGSYSGGAFVSAATRNLSAFNALTFWAKSSVANATLKVGVGNNAATTVLNAESIGIPLTTTFTKYIIPLPNPAKMINVNGLFHFADGPLNYTVWFSDVQYELLPTAQVATATAALAAFPTVAVGVGASFQMNAAPNTVNFTVPALPNGGKLSDVAWRWFTLTSSNPAVATVSIDGLITGVSAGTATISATMNGLPVTGSAAVTVTAPLAVPTTIAAAPTKAASDVISLFTTAYTNRGVDTWRTGWSAAHSELVDPYVVAGRNIKRYSLFNFVGIEFGPANAANNIDASTMTSIHVNIWSPNPSSNLEIQLVNDATGAAAIGKYQAGAIAANTWVSLNIPLSSFVGLTAKNKLQQMLFVGASPTVIYMDNLYFFK